MQLAQRKREIVRTLNILISLFVLDLVRRLCWVPIVLVHRLCWFPIEERTGRQFNQAVRIPVLNEINM